jgi:hypothetical protein
VGPQAADDSAEVDERVGLLREVPFATAFEHTHDGFVDELLDELVPEERIVAGRVDVLAT